MSVDYTNNELAEYLEGLAEIIDNEADYELLIESATRLRENQPEEGSGSDD